MTRPVHFSLAYTSAILHGMHILRPTIAKALSTVQQWRIDLGRERGGVFVLFFSSALLLTATTALFVPMKWAHIGAQAEGFLDGSIMLHPSLRPETWLDVIVTSQGVTATFGPFPAAMAVILTAFAPVTAELRQSIVAAAILLSTFFLAARLARRSGLGATDSLFLAVAFCFASVYHVTTLAPLTWGIMDATVALLLLLGILESFEKKRAWLLGSLTAAIALTRPTSALVGLYFFFVLTREDRPTLKTMGLFFLPIAIAVSLWGIFNQARFGSPFEFGYRQVNAHHNANYYGAGLGDAPLFGIAYVPTNLYAYFLAGPLPHNDEQTPSSMQRVWVRDSLIPFDNARLDPPYIDFNPIFGGSFFLVSPIFVLLLNSDWKQRRIRWALITLAVGLVPLLFYFWPGTELVGPRYLIDLLPFAFLALLSAFPDHKLLLSHRVLIVGSAVANISFALIGST